MSSWFNNEALWRDFYPYIFSEERIEAAAEEVRQICELTGVREGAVLDLACGPGRHAVAFAERGFDVTGVDLTPFLLEKARERAKNAQAVVEWVRSDMREFVRPEAFDLAVSLFTSFGYFDDEEDDIRVLKNIRESLSARGTCVIDVMGKERIARDFEPTFSERLSDDSLLVQRREITDDWSRIQNEWVLVRDDTAITHRFEHAIYSGRELKDRLQQAGFADIRLYGGFGGSPYDRQAQRLVAVAKKR